MKRTAMKKWLAAALAACAVILSVPLPAQAAKKAGLPQKEEMKKQGFVYIKGGTFQMGSPKTENWRTKDEKSEQV